MTTVFNRLARRRLLIIAPNLAPSILAQGPARQHTVARLVTKCAHMQSPLAPKAAIFGESLIGAPCFKVTPPTDRACVRRCSFVTQLDTPF